MRILITRTENGPEIKRIYLIKNDAILLLN
jgi:hypothetical protein